MKTVSGKLFIVSAPSGVGKTTIIREVMKARRDLCFSVSSTTRPPRPGEISGKDYHFTSREEFLNGVRAGDFLEWAEVHGRFYGTGAGPIRDWLELGRDVLLDIDVQGARQVRCFYPEAHTIFILPPSFEVLEQRLTNRGTESPEQLTKRLAASREEIAEGSWYDFIIVNDILEDAVEDFKAVLRACRCLRGFRAPLLRDFLLQPPPPVQQ